MTFGELAIGDTFDFVSGNRIMDSFSEPCKKISARKYKYPTGKPEPSAHYIARVGTLKVNVYHVGREYPTPPPRDNPRD